MYAEQDKEGRGALGNKPTRGKKTLDSMYLHGLGEGHVICPPNLCKSDVGD